MKHLSIGENSRIKLADALEAISLAVGSTLGPGGRPFGFDKLGADMRLSASFTKDGLTVLKSLSFNDPAMDAVLQYCKQASSNSVLASGDGTTSTIVLANAVAQAILKSKNSKVPQALARQIESEANKAIACIRSEAVKSMDAVKHVALTSANGDEELANVVLEAIKESSAFGTLVVEKNPASSIRYKISKQDGYSGCGGYNYNNTLALSASANGEAAASRPLEWDNPLVLLFNGNIHLVPQIEPVLAQWGKACSEKPRHLVIVCYETSDEICNKLLVVNRQMGKHGVGVFIVKPRLTAEINSGLQIMRDLAAFCGIHENRIVDGGNFRDLDVSFFGTCRRVSIALTHTAFLGRAENHWVEERVKQNHSIVENARSEFDKQITSIRNAELAEGLVKVEIGGGLLPDLQERADRFDDASKAAQSCMKDGALPGCGVSYIRAGELAKVGPELSEALQIIHKTVLLNYGVQLSEKRPTSIGGWIKFLFKPKRKVLSYPVGHTVRIDSTGIQTGPVDTLKVYDACETVCSVIKNGVSLGCQVAIAGGFSYRPRKAEDDAEMTYGN
ncbi:MAG: TCP-1/cpn60 chaperonin family protein [Thermoplasmatales archaeon]